MGSGDFARIELADITYEPLRVVYEHPHGWVSFYIWWDSKGCYCLGKDDPVAFKATIEEAWETPVSCSIVDKLDYGSELPDPMPYYRPRMQSAISEDYYF